MVNSKLRIIVSGLIAQYPLGGVTWDYLQYVLGLARLGHDVYYLEDTGLWPYNPREGGVSEGCAYNVEYLGAIMSRFGLGDRWAYRFPHKSQWFGLPGQERKKLISTADLLINVSCSLQNISDYHRVNRKVLIDTDPVFTQIKLAKGQADFRKQVDMHDACFSFGECFSSYVPVTGDRWRATRQPVVLSEWQPSNEHRTVFTTVMNWTSYKPLKYEGRTYGQKDVEFMRFLELPGMVSPATIEIAVNEAGKTRRTPHRLLTYKGWHLVDPSEVCPDLDSYRDYIKTSMAEWSVAKNGYVVGRPGWFSCRSACYLAAGRPVIVQDTGFTSVIPVGQGLVTFGTLNEAAAAINEVSGNYHRHAKTARDIAEEYFDSDKILTRLIEEALNIVD